MHTENIVLGAGEIFIDVHDAGGATGGERYLGDSPGATISVTTERTTIQSSDGAVARDLVDKIRSVSRVMGFTIQDASIENWALFLIGNTATATIAAVAAVASVGDIVLGVPAQRWAPIKKGDYEVGEIVLMKDANGEIDASAVTKGVASGSAAGDTAAAGTDYHFDEKTGRIFNNTDAALNFQVAKGTTGGRTVMRAQATASAAETICSIRYVEDEVAGTAPKGRNVLVKKANLVPSGEAALKSRDTPQQFAFTATILDPGGAEPALTIDGEDAA